MVLIRSVPHIAMHDTKSKVSAHKLAKIARHGVSQSHLKRASRSSSVCGPRRRHPHDNTVMVCSSVQDWLLDKSAEYRCLHVPRQVTWGDVQPMVDLLASSGCLGRAQFVAEVVKLTPLGECDLQIADKFSERARRLVAKVPHSYLSRDLLQQIQHDIAEVGPVMAQMLPSAEEVLIKLEIFGEHTCSRWHQDKYTCRAIITYNGHGTDYVQHSNVDFWELKNCGNNDCILHDKTKVFWANAGDVFFMKGVEYPGDVNGLVHKSPEKRYHVDGSIMCRLCLKLDVM